MILLDDEQVNVALGLLGKLLDGEFADFIQVPPFRYDGEKWGYVQDRTQFAVDSGWITVLEEEAALIDLLRSHRKPAEAPVEAGEG